MSELPQLSQEEQQAIDAIIARLSKRAKQQFTLEDLLQKWIDFVIKVEQGYSDSIYEYTNDLSVRDLLEEIIREAPKAFGDKFLPLIKKWDEKFLSITKETISPLKKRLTPFCQTPFWWKRIPINLKGELKEDLRSG